MSPKALDQLFSQMVATVGQQAYASFYQIFLEEIDVKKFYLTYVTLVTQFLASHDIIIILITAL